MFVVEFSTQTNICVFYIQNICSGACEDSYNYNAEQGSNAEEGYANIADLKSIKIQKNI